jgi:hypothetical protein
MLWLTSVAFGATVLLFTSRDQHRLWCGRRAAPAGLALIVFHATPITSCGQVLTSNGILTGDLHCAGLDGVVVGADKITIDLNGFALVGDLSLGRFGVSDGGYDQVTVKNGIVRNFYVGVYGMTSSTSSPRRPDWSDRLRSSDHPDPGCSSGSRLRGLAAA